MQVGGVDHVTDGLDAFYEFTKVGHHVFPLNDLGIARKCRWEQSLVYQGLKSHHDGVVCSMNSKKVMYDWSHFVIFTYSSKRD